MKNYKKSINFDDNLLNLKNPFTMGAPGSKTAPTGSEGAPEPKGSKGALEPKVTRSVNAPALFQ